MNREDAIRAWRDEEFRADLSPSMLAELPDHPAGTIELPQDALPSGGGVAGAVSTEGLWSLGCCNGFTRDPVSGLCCPSHQPNCNRTNLC